MKIVLDSIYKACPFHNGEFTVCQITEKTCFGLFRKSQECPLNKGSVKVILDLEKEEK